jgi:hypothetical protein
MMQEIRDEIKRERLQLERLIVEQNRQLMNNGLHSILDLNNKLTKMNSSKGKITLKAQHSQPTHHTR